MSSVDEWRAQTPVGPRRASVIAADALRVLEEKAIALPPGNRLQAAERLLKELPLQRAPQSLDAEERLQLVNAMRTALDFALVRKALERRPTSATPEKVEKLRIALSGATVPERDRNSLARDIQFELFLEAFLIMGGASVRFSEPPDLVLRYGPGNVGVAAKRLRSRRKVRDRVKGAIAQLERAGRRGFVAVNMDGFVDSESVTRDWASYAKALELASQPLASTAALVAQRHTVIGVWTFATSVRYDEKIGPCVTPMHRFMWFGDDPYEKQLGADFFHGLQARLSRSLGSIWR